jgi:hypothetical protein
MGTVTVLDEYRLKRRTSTDPNMNVASCMYCSAEFPWGERLDHQCAASSHARHPSSQ